MRLIHCLTGVIKLANTKVIDYEKLYSLAKIGLSEEQIATSLGISASTVTRRKRDDEQFDRTLKAGKQAGIDAVTNALFQGPTGVKPSSSAQIFFLKNGAGWLDTTEVDTNLTGYVIVNHNLKADMKCLKDAGLEATKLLSVPFMV